MVDKQGRPDSERYNGDLVRKLPKLRAYVGW